MHATSIFASIAIGPLAASIAETSITLAVACALGYLLRIVTQRSRSPKPMPFSTVHSTPQRTNRRFAHPDDLTGIEGISQQVEVALNKSGIATYADLATLNSAKIISILHKNGEIADQPFIDTWTTQAQLARDSKVEELVALQLSLRKQ